MHFRIIYIVSQVFSLSVEEWYVKKYLLTHEPRMRAGKGPRGPVQSIPVSSRVMTSTAWNKWFLSTFASSFFYVKTSKQPNKKRKTCFFFLIFKIPLRKILSKTLYIPRLSFKFVFFFLFSCCINTKKRIKLPATY